jgi:hypothetical protein
MVVIREQFRWVYGNRTKKWYKVTKNDRDYSMGIADWQFKNMTKKEARNLWNVPTFIPEPYGLPRELQPAGKFRNAYDDLDTIARLMFGIKYEALSKEQKEKTRAKYKMIYPDRNVMIMHSKKLKKVV